MNNIETRKRIFEILNNLYGKYSLKKDLFIIARYSGLKKFQPQNIPNVNEILELVCLLTNNNPYIKFHQSNLNIFNSVPFLDQEKSALGSYNYQSNTITLDSNLLINIYEDPNGFLEFLSTICHEQRHHEQYVEDTTDLQFIQDIKRELFYGTYTQSEMKEILEFLKENNLQEDLSPKQIRKYQFGAYLSNACEIDARNHAHKYTNLIIKKLINDDLCSEKLKKKLSNRLEGYNDTELHYIEDHKTQMQQFVELRKKLKDIFNNLINNKKEKLSEAKYLNILNKVMLNISKEMSAEEKIKYIEWAVDNKHIELLDQISYNKNEADKETIYEFLNKTIDTQKLSYENYIQLFTINSIQFNSPEERKQKTTELVLKLINNSQIGYLQNLIDSNLKESIDLVSVTKSFVPYAKNYLQNTNKYSFRLLICIRNTLLSLIYGGIDEEIIKTLKPIYDECCKKIVELNPNKNNEIGDLLTKIRLEHQSKETIINN